MVAGTVTKTLSSLHRAALLALAGYDIVIGAWAGLAPYAFFTGFPGLGLAWVAALPPYNRHLVADVGGAVAGLAVAQAAAALLGDRRSALVALLAGLTQSVSHLVFHLAEPTRLPVGQAVASRIGLAVPVALAGWLLVSVLRTGEWVR